jgi:Fe-S oxidoreductase
MLIAEHTSTIEACRFCFMCRHVCTVGVISGKESDTPRGKGLILFKLLKGHIEYGPELVDTLYRCCLCGLCQTWCKAGCEPPEAVLAARADVVAQGKEPESVRQIKEHLLTTGNPFGLPADARFQAILAPDLFRPRAEVLYYVGCDTAYCQPEIAGALVRILQAAKVDFSLLPKERSTGKPLWLLGYRAEARAMAQALVAQIRATQCRTLITGCPSSFDAFTKDFPAMGLDLGGIEVLHTAQYLDRLGQEGRLIAQRPTVSSATLLDGTYLGRKHAIFDPPRRVLQRLPGLAVREMGWSRELAYSAGESGGVFRLLQPDLSRQMAARVLAEAATTGAEVLVTTCPATKAALAEAKPSSPRVLDLAELVAQAVG